jgi:hypothetical protein
VQLICSAIPNNYLALARMECLNYPCIWMARFVQYSPKLSRSTRYCKNPLPFWVVRYPLANMPQNYNDTLQS